MPRSIDSDASYSAATTRSEEAAHILRSLNWPETRVQDVASGTTSWQDVSLALAGAPVGALITVVGVMLTNRSSRASQERQLAAQLAQQRASLEHDLKSEHQRRVLATRADLYAELLEICESVEQFKKWIDASAGDPSIAEPDPDDFFRQVLSPLRKCRGRVAVFCPSEVRRELWQFSDALESFDSDWSRSVDLHPAAERMRGCVIEAAIVDRTSGLAPEGLGGM